MVHPKVQDKVTMTGLFSAHCCHPCNPLKELGTQGHIFILRVPHPSTNFAYRCTSLSQASS